VIETAFFGQVFADAEAKESRRGKYATIHKPVSMAAFGFARAGVPDMRVQEGVAIERVLALRSFQVSIARCQHDDSGPECWLRTRRALPRIGSTMLVLFMSSVLKLIRQGRKTS
jgi:hypothetical protein